MGDSYTYIKDFYDFFANTQIFGADDNAAESTEEGMEVVMEEETEESVEEESEC